MNRTFYKFAAVVLMGMCLMPAVTMSQISHGGTPKFNHSGTKISAATYELTPLSNEQYLREDVGKSSHGGAMRVSVARHETIDILEHATCTKKEGRTYFLMSITSPNATQLSLHFSQYQIPEGATLYLYDESGDFVIGQFRNEDRKKDGTFYTQSIPGSTVYIEYSVPTGKEPGQLTVDEVSHGYKEIFAGKEYRANEEKGPHGSSQGSCHTNVICPDADEWRNEIRSVVAMEVHDAQYGYMCSGALINNARQDRTPYVYSAYHCQSMGTVTRVVFYFLYETNSCTGSVGTSNLSITGCTTVAKKDGEVADGADMWLMRLDNAIPDAYRPYYAGWSRETKLSPTLGVGIHHPGGDYKKISIPENYRQSTGELANYYAVTWRQQNNKGVTEEGSSGSPLFNGEHQIIGKLTGGYSACNSLSGMDYYGSLHIDWATDPDDNESLHHWLDPDNTGISTLGGLNYSDVSIEDPKPQYHELRVFPNPTNGIVRFDVETIGEANYKVFNINGQCIYEGHTILTSTEQSINITSLPKGTYMILLYTATKNYHTRVVKL